MCIIYGNTGCWVSSGGYKTRKILLNFENWCYGELSNIGYHFIGKKSNFYWFLHTNLMRKINFSTWHFFDKALPSMIGLSKMVGLNPRKEKCSTLCWRISSSEMQVVFSSHHTHFCRKNNNHLKVSEPSQAAQNKNDENDAWKREDFETTRLTFFPSSTFETLCMFYFSQFLQLCNYTPSRGFSVTRFDYTGA